MIYLSPNLECPDLQRHFLHVHCRPMGHSRGHDVLSDFSDRPAGDELLGLYKNCGFWTHSEAQILYNVARQVGGTALDIGSHTGWTAAHMRAAGCSVTAIDPMYRVPEFLERAKENIREFEPVAIYVGTSNEYFAEKRKFFHLVVIDGDHGEPNPYNDAVNADKHLTENGAILFHDAYGRPVWRAVKHLMDHGYKCRWYDTPHGVALCWRGDQFVPPDYVADSSVEWAAIRRHMQPEFPFSRCQ